MGWSRIYIPNWGIGAIMITLTEERREESEDSIEIYSERMMNLEKQIEFAK